MKTIELSEDFTMEEALKTKQELNMMAQDADSILVDATKVQKADIVGINALATTQKLLIEKGGNLKVKLSRQSELYKMLHLTKFTYLIELIVS